MAYQWKISFNPDPNKQTIEVYFSFHLDETCHQHMKKSENQKFCEN